MFVEELKKTWTKYVMIPGILAEIWARDLPSNMTFEDVSRCLIRQVFVLSYETLLSRAFPWVYC